jgi:hypothetical protein
MQLIALCLPSQTNQAERSTAWIGALTPKARYLMPRFARSAQLRRAFARSFDQSCLTSVDLTLDARSTAIEL